MANYGKYYIAVRLLLLKQYLEANAGRNRIVMRRELETLLAEHDMPVEKKTLYADFAALGDVCGLQLEYKAREITTKQKKSASKHNGKPCTESVDRCRVSLEMFQYGAHA